MFLRLKNCFTDYVHIIPHIIYIRCVNRTWSYVTVCDWFWQFAKFFTLINMHFTLSFHVYYILKKSRNVNVSWVWTNMLTKWWLHATQMLTNPFQNCFERTIRILSFKKSIHIDITKIRIKCSIKLCTKNAQKSLKMRKKNDVPTQIFSRGL